MRISRGNFFLVLLVSWLLCGPRPLSAANLPAPPRVYLDTSYAPPTGKSITVNAGGNLQAALDRAAPGDEIVLQAGASFMGNYTLPRKDGAGWIILRSSRLSALPPAGTRVSPANAADMARIVTQNSDPALATQPGAHHYRLMGLEITIAPSVPMSYVAVRLGDKSPSVDQLPTDIVLDRDYIHGSVLCHCKRGVMLNSRRTAVIDSYISEFHAIDQDVQALAGINGPGPFKIVNNYLEASTENLMFGGDVAGIHGVIPSDIEFRRNYLTKPVRWRGSIIPMPANVTANAEAGGSLPGGTYYYDVIALGPGDSVASLRSDPAEIKVQASGGRNTVTLTWAPVAYGDSTDSRKAASYMVYRTKDGPSVKTRNWTSYTVPAAASPSFTDAGAAGSFEPLRRGHRWLVKNLLELKNAQRMQIEANVLEYSWEQGQSGYAILLTPRIAGDQFWPVVSDISFRNNIIRHAGNMASVLGIDGQCFRRDVVSQCVQSARVLFENNLFDDISKARWGGNGWLFLAQSTSHLTIVHNTAVNDGAALALGRAFGDQANVNNTGLSVTNNILCAPFSGVVGSGAAGKNALVKFAPDAVLKNNVLIGGDAGRLDASMNNHFPKTPEAVGFLNFAQGDYRLAATSSYMSAGTDQQRVGADIASILAATAGVTSGGPASKDPPRRNLE